MLNRTLSFFFDCQVTDDSAKFYQSTSSVPDDTTRVARYGLTSGVARMQHVKNAVSHELVRMTGNVVLIKLPEHRLALIVLPKIFLQEVKQGRFQQT